MAKRKIPKPHPAFTYPTPPPKNFHQGYVRHTSAAAYHNIKNNGLLTEGEWRTYDFLYWFGPLNGSQLDESCWKHAHKRCSELEARGVVKEAWEDIDKNTGEIVIYWDVTDLDTPRARQPMPQSARVPRKHLEARLQNFENQSLAVSLAWNTFFKSLTILGDVWTQYGPTQQVADTIVKLRSL